MAAEPSGFTATFTRNSDGSYNDAPGIEATLVHTSLNDTLTFHATGEVYVFSSTGGGLESDQDKNGNQLTLGTGGKLTDTQGRVGDWWPGRHHRSGGQDHQLWLQRQPAAHQHY